MLKLIGSIFGAIILLILVMFAINVLMLVTALAAFGELIIELEHGSYSLGTLITASLLTMAIVSVNIGGVTKRKNAQEAAGAALGELLVKAVFFMSVYVLPLFGVHPPARFMSIYNAIFPIWIALFITAFALVIVLLYIAIKY